MKMLALLTTLVSVNVTNAQTIWTVDLDPATGADFAQIQPAIDSASPGDTILVGPGTYSRFDLGKGLSIIGTVQASPTGALNPVTSLVPASTGLGAALVQSVPAGEVAAIADLRSSSWIFVRGNSGTVVLDRVQGPVSFGDNVDSRARACDSSFDIYPTTGWAEFAEPVGALWVGNSSMPAANPRVLVSNPRLRGADAWGYPSCFSSHFYDSTSAITATWADLIVTGRPTDHVWGGDRAIGSCVFLPGSPGIRLAEGSLRTSGATVRSLDPTIMDLSLGVTVTLTEPVTPDPSLRLEGEPLAGASVTLVIDGAPGDEARLELGTGAALASAGTSAVPRLVYPGRTFPMGPLPTTGSLGLSLQIPAGTAPGTLFWFQAWTVTPFGMGRRTNSLPLLIRP